MRTILLFCLLLTCLLLEACNPYEMFEAEANSQYESCMRGGNDIDTAKICANIVTDGENFTNLARLGGVKACKIIMNGRYASDPNNIVEYCMRAWYFNTMAVNFNSPDWKDLQKAAIAALDGMRRTGSITTREFQIMNHGYGGNHRGELTPASQFGAIYFVATFNSDPQEAAAHKDLIGWAAAQGCMMGAGRSTCDDARRAGQQVDQRTADAAYMRNQERGQQLAEQARRDKENYINSEKQKYAEHQAIRDAITNGISQVESMNQVQQQPVQVPIYPQPSLGRVANEPRPNVLSSSGQQYAGAAGGQRSGAPGNIGGSSAAIRPAADGPDCTNMSGYVNFIHSNPTGMGHCTNEVTGRITNNSNATLDCYFDFYKGGVKTGDGGADTLRPGETHGGEGWGIWSCGADDIRYVCFRHQADAIACKVRW
ncbi:hypothetical protein C9I57_28355 [Trinickia symbiotica]|uniref:Uncharacterized protein n=1 Tax=Trinickia symbiotica TaxID=863227 RepID=A0A2T3XLN5_9BURK|nr:hypothetical protein C9I57_28355 [Trinickia symbiotica]